MSMMFTLDNLRAKPEHVRRRIAFWTSFGITLVIFAFWLGSFDTLGNSSKNAISAAVNKVQSPARSLVASVGQFFLDVKDLVFGPKKIQYSTIEVSPGK